MFEKNLTDLVRGIRNNKSNEAKYIATCLDEIKNELRQENIAVKANAVAKLSYLQMLGYDISWAAFNIIEVMSSSKFTFKRSGYVTASQCFHEDLDVLMLTTNMIRKDLSSQNMYDAGSALSGLSCFVTHDLARDLANDLMSLLVSTKPYLRKKAVLVMYKIFLKFPEALRPAFPRLKEKLEDPDPGVQSAAVNVICELARKNPKNYLSLAPLFFKLMTSSTNNWMLIKIIKLFGALCPLEPRLGKKLTEPLTNLIHSTSAMSLLYECINTVVAGMPNHGPTVQLCVTKLRMLLEDTDQNLKYLGLLAMGKILTCQPKLVQQHKDIILQCLDDTDESIRLRALDLITGMISKKNLMDIVKKLMSHMDSAEGTTYRDELLSKTIQICSQSDYQYITNFEWYIDILVQLTRIEGTRHGKLIAAQMLDITIRVQAVRPYAVQCLSLLLDNSQLLSGSQQQKNGMCEVLYAAAWVSGEFAQHLADPAAVLNAMLRPRVTSLPGHIQGVYVQNILKLYAHILKKAEEEGDQESITNIGELMIDRFPMFVQSSDLEVQERACCALQIIKYVIKLQGKDISCSQEICALFAGDLNPVAPKAQKKVPVPEGLDLDKWIHEPPKESYEEDIDWDDIFLPKEHKSKHGHRKRGDKSDRVSSEKTSKKSSENELSDEEISKRREARKQEQASNPHYLRMDTSPKTSSSPLVEDIPVASLDIPVSLHVAGAGISNDKKSSKKSKKRRKKGRKGKHDEESDEESYPAQKYEVLAVEGVEPIKGEAGSDHEDSKLSVDDPHRMLDIDLEKPLEATEVLPVRTHRVTGVASPEPTSQDQVEQKRSRHREKEKRHRGKHRHRKDKEEKSKKSEKKRHQKSHEDHPSGEERKHKSKKDEYQQPDEEPVPDMMVLEDDDHELEENEEVVASVPTSPEPNIEVRTIDQPKPEQLEDMDFWLSNTTTAEHMEKPKEELKQQEPEEELKKPEKKESKKKEKKEKSKIKDKKEKRRKGKEKRKTSECADEENATESKTPTTAAAEEEPAPTIGVEEPQQQEVISTYRILKENESLKLIYDTRVNPQNSSQVIASIIFSNLTSCHIKSLELNVLDSLNTKLVRPIGYSSHDSIQVPFQLPPGASNEGQFAFTVESVVMSQKLRGTLTYMIKDAEGSTSEKMDFKIHLPCSAFIVATPLSSHQFTSLLGSGSISCKQSIKITVGEEANFRHLINKLCSFIHVAVVEFVDENVSLYGYSIQHHHVCLLVKKLDNGVISVDGKSSEDTFLSNILQEMKEILQ